MSKCRNDGGPAFPVDRHGPPYACEGMTLRDYFAAQVAGSLGGAAFFNPNMSWSSVAEAAYAIADAMLARRGAS